MQGASCTQHGLAAYHIPSLPSSLDPLLPLTCFVFRFCLALLTAVDNCVCVSSFSEAVPGVPFTFVVHCFIDRQGK